MAFVPRAQAAAVRAEVISDIGLLLGLQLIPSGPDEGAAMAIAEVERLRSDAGIPTRLRDIGVTEEMLPGFADKAFAIKRLMRVNPRMPTRDDILGIYREAF